MDTSSAGPPPRVAPTCLAIVLFMFFAISSLALGWCGEDWLGRSSHGLALLQLLTGVTAFVLSLPQVAGRSGAWSWSSLVMNGILITTGCWLGVALAVASIPRA